MGSLRPGVRSGTPYHAHQQVNRIWDVLAGRGLIQRMRRRGGVIVNKPLRATRRARRRPGDPAPHRSRRVHRLLAGGDATVEAETRFASRICLDLSGLYRFIVRIPGDYMVDFGEAADLARRMNGYRNPGSSQQTNRRLNQILRGAPTAWRDGHVRDGPQGDVPLHRPSAPSRPARRVRPRPLERERRLRAKRREATPNAGSRRRLTPTRIVVAGWSEWTGRRSPAEVLRSGPRRRTDRRDRRVRRGWSCAAAAPRGA